MPVGHTPLRAPSPAGRVREAAKVIQRTWQKGGARGEGGGEKTARARGRPHARGHSPSALAVRPHPLLEAEGAPPRAGPGLGRGSCSARGGEAWRARGAGTRLHRTRRAPGAHARRPAGRLCPRPASGASSPAPRPEAPPTPALTAPLRRPRLRAAARRASGLRGLPARRRRPRLRARTRGSPRHQRRLGPAQSGHVRSLRPAQHAFRGTPEPAGQPPAPEGNLGGAPGLP